MSFLPIQLKLKASAWGIEAKELAKHPLGTQVVQCSAVAKCSSHRILHHFRGENYACSAIAFFASRGETSTVTPSRHEILHTLAQVFAVHFPVNGLPPAFRYCYIQILWEWRCPVRTRVDKFGSFLRGGLVFQDFSFSQG